VDYYTRVLGMAVDFTAPGWAFLSRGLFRLMLGECADTVPAHETADHSYFAYVTVEGIDQFYDEVLGNGASLMQGLVDKPWGMRDFGVRTRTGTGLCLARNSEPPAAERRYELDLQHAACHQI
ncbi:MAG TPA: VOC family protein, partial [Pyrinomonadaceae bacterium]|nr:VOC family protein [Pyrinomonadaceae bacterium]